MKKIAFISTLILLVSVFSACNNDEGRGGTSIVQGYVFNVIHDNDDFSMTADTVPAAKNDVYIAYGNGRQGYEKREAAPDGFYQFKYLTKGNYTVFSYSTPDAGAKIAEEVHIKVGSGTNTVENIYIHSGKAFGTAMIKGQVEVRWWYRGDRDFVEGNFSNEFLNNLPKYAANVRVFLRHENQPFHIDDVRTDENGVFIFQRLQPGKYEVFTYSADEYFLKEINVKVDVPEFYKIDGKKQIIEITKEDIGTIVPLSEPLKIIDTL